MTPQAADAVKVIVAATCITVVEIVALCKGKNGFMLRLVIVALAGLAGFSLAEMLR